MNIAHCIHGLGLGGAQQIIKTLVRGRDQEAFRYFVYCCLDGHVRQEVERAGVTVRLIERRLPKLDPGWVVKLTKAMKRDGIELVHCHLFGDSLHGYLAAQAAGGLPVILTLHSKPEILPFLQTLGYRWLLSRCARVVACSKSTQDSFVAANWLQASDFLVIGNGIEGSGEERLGSDRRSRLRRELGLDPEAMVFASVGRLVEEKGYPHLIRAFARLVRSDDRRVRLVLLGTGPLGDELRRLVSAERVSDEVVFAGFRPNVRELLPAFDAVVFSSLSEGLPVALLEAMAAARPIVGTEVPGILEAVRHEREALIVPVASVGGLADAMRRLATDTALRSELGQAARQRFLERFTSERMVRGYEALYREVLADWEARR